MKNKAFILSMIILVLVGGSCSEDWLNVNTDPNNPTNPDIDLLFPAGQLGISQTLVHDDALGYLHALGQNSENPNTTQYIFSGASFTDAWNDFYTLSLINLEKIIADGTEQELPAYVAIAKLNRAYVYTVIIDLWGTAPFSEAVQGAQGPDNPAFEDGEDVYTSVLASIDEALTTLSGLGSDAIMPSTELAYGGDIDNWIKMGNTLKLKMYINLAMVESRRSEAVAAINALIQEDNLIDDFTDDFQIRYGSGLAPENRHPWHQSEYQGNKSHYIGNFIMHRMYNEYGVMDPRIRYYFYRQVLEPSPIEDNFPCYPYGARPSQPSTWTATCAIGYVGEGYIGRDHGDGSGGPNDGHIRTTFGVYPILGLFDENSAKAVAQTDGTGAGIVPMLTSYMTKFYLAEAALLYGTTGDARTYLEEGMEQSISKVMNFGRNNATNYDADYEPSQSQIDEYISTIMGMYDSAAPDNIHSSVTEAQLDVIMGQFQLANFGNPIESYNNFRRTKYPFVPVAHNNTEAMSIIPVNNFPRRLPFPQDEINTNTNAPSPSEIDWRRNPVFWDTKTYPIRFDGNR